MMAKAIGERPSIVMMGTSKSKFNFGLFAVVESSSITTRYFMIQKVVGLRSPFVDVGWFLHFLIS